VKNRLEFKGNVRLDGQHTEARDAWRATMEHLYQNSQFSSLIASPWAILVLSCTLVTHFERCHRTEYGAAQQDPLCS